MSDPSTSANGLTLDITSDDPGIAYSREAYAEVCRLRAEIEALRRARERYRKAYERERYWRAVGGEIK